MEDLIAVDSIRREIISDAEKKAMQILTEADAEAEREIAAGRSLAESTAAAIERACADRIARRRSEAAAREPLDRMRLLVEFVDRNLKEALDRYFDALSEEAAVRIALALVSKVREVFKGRRLRVGRRGLPERAAVLAAESLGPHAAVTAGEDFSLPSRGLSIETDDGCERYTATLDMAKERLLDERRGELAQALCGEAMGDMHRNQSPLEGEMAGNG